ncbi:MAG: inositol monophosphatase [Chloroflexota bacterium]|nr:inositol monophosphatase [Chloroflexota bacterium]
MTLTGNGTSYEALRVLAVEAAREAGDWLASQFGDRIATTPKGDDSLVTELDVQSEAMITARIRSLYPEHTVIGEESSPHAARSGWAWAVDPIDGTRNFASGVPVWAVSVAAMEEGRPVAAAAYLPAVGEMFEAAEGGGARLNGRTLRVSDTQQLADAVVMTDLLPKGHPDQLSPEVLAGLIAAARRTRMLGSVCAGMCYTAAGRFDVYYRPLLSVWDVAAGVLLVREAGGVVRSFSGDDWHANTSSVLAANGTLVKQLLAEHNRLEQKHPAH